MKKYLIALLAGLAFASLSPLAASAAAFRADGAATAGSTGDIVQVRHGPRMRHGNRGRHLGWARGRHRGWGMRRGRR